MINQNNALKVSKTGWTVEVTKNNSESTHYNLDITVSAFTPVDGLTYVMEIDGTKVTYSDGWSFTNLGYDIDYAIALYVYGSCTDGTSGFTDYNSATTPVTAGSVFTLTATSVA